MYAHCGQHGKSYTSLGLRRNSRKEGRKRKRKKKKKRLKEKETERKRKKKKENEIKALKLATQC